ncbi:MAG: MotA/TolQ/ExbB proton channel family protein [Treponema sp.]|nr:MotA/TolQ/ExbB proton channel family protein [Treponema sp.]
MKLIEFINLGGPVNWVLAALLCFCVCQCIERGIYFFQTRRGSKRDVLLRLQTKMSECANLENQKKEKAFQSECSILYYEMNRGLWFLNFISSVAPSLGLLGTVTGLISAFSKLSEAGTNVNISDLSGGIWEAMLTTAFGMIISIPSLLCYRTFKRIIEKRLLAMSLYDEDEDAQS